MSHLLSFHNFKALCPILIILLSVVQLSWQQKDPLNDFCRRFGQQTTVIDRKLYIDGGLLNWNPISQNPENYSNPYLLFNDLDNVGGGGMPQLYANLSKNASIPALVGGVLWGDNVNKRFYLFGGEYYNTPPVSFKLLAYDAIYDKWDSFGPPSTSISDVAWGAGVAISESGEGYYYGGWISNTTTPEYVGNPVATTGLIRYDMDTNIWTNNTGPDSVPRAEGVMVYIPAGDKGLLIYFGGLSALYGNGTSTPSPMSTIFIYDIASSNWYRQTATGDVPENRRRFCAGATWASDQSSYNIYLYGGAGFGANSSGFDDIYILSLPSFTWIKWYQGDPASAKAHHSLTCNVIDGAQMLIIGGTFPLTNDCDAPIVWGTHNLNLGKQNSQNAMWYGYQPNITSYIVPPEIISKVGGSSLGGATVTAPATWFNQDLSVYFTRTASIAARTATRSIPTPSSTNSTTSATTTPKSPPGPPLSVAAIAGIAVGGSVILGLLALGCFCLRRRHRSRRGNNTNPLPPNPTPKDAISGFQPSPYQSPPMPEHNPNYPQYTSPRQEQQDVITHELSANDQQANMEPKYDFASTQAFMNSVPENINKSKPPEMYYGSAHSPNTILVPSSHSHSHSQPYSHSSYPLPHQSYDPTYIIRTNTASPHSSSTFPLAAGSELPVEPSELSAYGPLSRQPRASISRVNPPARSAYVEHSREHSVSGASVGDGLGRQEQRYS